MLAKVVVTFVLNLRHMMFGTFRDGEVAVIPTSLEGVKWDEGKGRLLIKMATNAKPDVLHDVVFKVIDSKGEEVVQQDLFIYLLKECME